jgi:hypothetical protein
MKLNYDYNKTNNGYFIKEYNVEKNIDLHIDATYIIHLVNNGRLIDIQNQLNKYRTSKKIYILFNEGYKCKKKSEKVKNAASDLIDANLYILNHANENEFTNILILEDDFFFDNSIFNRQYTNEINNFLKNINYDTYHLGCLPYFRKQLNDYHSKNILSTGTHAVIYSKNIIKSKNKENTAFLIADWDVYLKLYSQYMFNFPLCYQLFPVTENQKEWGKNVGFKKSMLKNQLLFNMKDLIKKLHLDKTHVIGYPYLYKISIDNYKNSLNKKNKLFNFLKKSI